MKDTFELENHPAYTEWMKVYLTFEKAHHTEGYYHPITGKLVKSYFRSISIPMAFQLKLMFNQYGIEKEFNVVDTKARLKVPERLGYNWSTLKHWGLIEAVEGTRDDGCKHTGVWVITYRGGRFAQGKIPVPKQKHEFRNKVIPNNIIRKETQYISACFADRFSFRDIMENYRDVDYIKEMFKKQKNGEQ